MWERLIGEFSPIFLSKNFCYVNNFDMKKNEYIQKAKNAILNRVKFHAPVVYDDKIDKTILFVNGIDINKPIFKFNKALNGKLLKAFSLAQQEEEFNLLLSTSSVENIKPAKLKNIKNLVIYSQQNSPVNFVEMINKLNINYQSSSNYNFVYKDKFFKINNQILNPSYKEFILRQNLVCDEVWVEYNEFVLNGNNFFVKFTNKSNKEKKLSLELNIPLKKGYYYFKRQSRCVSIENLLTKEKLFLNYFGKNCRFSFSNVDGLENSVFCCVNVKMNLTIESKQQKFVFFNLGDSEFALKNLVQINEFKDLSIKKCCEIFNVRVKTKEAKFDNFFNSVLPRKIWINWLNGEIDSALEEKYLSLKNLFVRGCDNFSFVPFKEIGVKEIGIFNGEYYKKIIIISSDQRFLRVGETFFYNINGISNRSLKNEEPIALSFGN